MISSVIQTALAASEIQALNQEDVEEQPDDENFEVEEDNETLEENDENIEESARRTNQVSFDICILTLL